MLLIGGYRLTSPEEDAVRAVLMGRGTRVLGEQLFLSTYTFQDHLKWVSDRTAVRGRRELVSGPVGPSTS